MKKWFLCILTALVLLSLGFAASAAGDAPAGTCGEHLTWRIENGVLTISGTGAMDTFDYSRSGRVLTKIDLPDGQKDVVLQGLLTTAPWGNYNGAVTQIVVEEGVTSIGEWAFSGMVRTRNVLLPTTLERIGRCAFYDCAYLTGIEIPDSVSELGDNAFTDCFWLRRAVVGRNVKDVSCFENCMALEEISLPAGLESIGYRAFYGCKALSGIDLPDSLVSIGQWAFYATGLKGVVSFGRSLTGIGRAAFGGAMDITAFEVDAANPALYTANGGVVSRESAALLALPSGLGEYTVPAGVKEIAPGLFDGAQNLRRVVLPEGLEHIGAEAFWDCVSLRELNLPSTLKTIGKEAFRLTRSLDDLELPEGLESIGEYAFRYSGVRRIRIPDSVTSLGRCAFRGCDNLEIAELGSGVTSLDGYFMDCQGLRSLVLPASLKRVDGYVLENCCLLRDVYFRGTQEDWDAADKKTWGNAPLFDAELHVAGTWSEADVTARRRTGGAISWRLTQGDDVLIISGEGPMPDYGEEGEGRPWADVMDGVRAVIVEEGVTHIGAGAFWNGANLHEISLPSTLTSIGYHAFSLYAEDYYGTDPGVITAEKVYDYLYFAGSSAQWRRVSLPEGYLGLEYALIRFGVQDVPYDPAALADLSGVPVPGDVSGDGAVDGADAVLLLRRLAGEDVDADKDAMDVNGDGAVDREDAIYLFRTAAGQDPNAVSGGRVTNCLAAFYRADGTMNGVFPVGAGGSSGALDPLLKTAARVALFCLDEENIPVAEESVIPLAG